MITKHKVLLVIFIVLLIIGISSYFSCEDTIQTKGGSETSLSQIASLITAISGLIGTLTTTYLALKQQKQNVK